MNDNSINIEIVAKNLADKVLANVRNSMNEITSSTMNTSKATNLFSDALSSMGRIAETALGFLSAQVITRIADGISTMATRALDGASNFEQIGISFRTMLGDGEKASKLMQEIAVAARTTPFELTELQKASKQLLAFGIDADQIIPTIIKLGDVSSGIGSSIGDIAYLYGTIKTAGVANTVDIKQFAGRGIPMWEYLAKVMGQSGTKLREMVEDSRVGFPEIEKAFTLMTEEGGKFAGMMTDQSKSLAGIQSNITDTIDQLLTKIMNDSGLFDFIKQGAENLLLFLESHSEEIQNFFKNLLQGALEIGNALRTGAKELQPFLELIASIFSNALGEVQPFLDIIANVFRDAKKEVDFFRGSFEDFIRKVKVPFEDLMRAIVNTVGELLPKIFRNITPLIESLKNLFSSSFGVWGDIFEKILLIAKPIFEYIGFWLGVVLPPIIAIATVIINAIASAFTEIWKVIEPVVDLISGIIETLFFAIQKNWETVVSPALNQLAEYWNSTLKPALEPVKKIFDDVFSWVRANVLNPVLELIDRISLGLANLREDTAKADEITTRIIDRRDEARGPAAKEALKKGGFGMIDYNNISNTDASKIARENNLAFAGGGDFITNGSQNILVGDNPSGRERVTITPLDGNAKNKGGMTIVNNFYGYNVEQISTRINQQLKLGY